MNGRRARGPSHRRGGGRWPGAARAVIVAMAVSAATLSAVSAPAQGIFTNSRTLGSNTVTAASSFPACYPDAVTADNPVAYWKLDETSGSAAVDTVAAWNGTYTSGVTLGAAGALPDTLNNRAASFNGIDGRVQVPYAAAHNPSQFTYEAWARPTGTYGGNVYHALVLASDEGNSSALAGIGVQIDNNDYWHVYLDSGATQTQLVGPRVQYGEWVHLAWTYNGTTLKLYVNGVQYTSANGPYTPNALVPLGIGMYAPYNTTWYDPFAGKIDEVAVFSTALSAAKILGHYTAGRCYKDEVLADGPAAYWRLGESAGATIATESMRGLHGTYTGSPTLGQAAGPTGDPNTSATFNGTSQYVTVPYSSSLNAGQYSIEVWAKPAATPAGYQGIVSTLRSSPQGYWVGVHNGSWSAEFRTTSGTTVETLGPAPTVGSWAHIVATYDGTTLTLYVNGVQQGSVSGSIQVNAAGPFSIGTGLYDGVTPQEGFAGEIDEVAVYPTALTVSRVQAHYLTGRSYRDTVVDRGPVSYWRLGETSGATTAADVKTSSPLTYVNTPSLGTAGAPGGDTDTAVTFDGTTRYAKRAYTPALNPGSLTVEAWVFLTGGSGFRTVLSTETAPTLTGFGLFADPSGNWAAEVQGAGTVFSATSPLTVDAWTHLAMTFASGTVSLYVNGVLANSTSAATYTPNTTNTTAVGCDTYDNTNFGECFTGTIDDVAVYNRALSAAEIKLDHDSGRR